MIPPVKSKESGQVKGKNSGKIHEQLLHRYQKRYRVSTFGSFYIHGAVVALKNSLDISETEAMQGLVGLCSNVELDESLGITNFVTVQRYPKWTIAERIKRKVLFKYVYKPIKRKNYLYSHDYNSF